jgi:hypothetical protein
MATTALNRYMKVTLDAADVDSLSHDLYFGDYLRIGLKDTKHFSVVRYWKSDNRGEDITVQYANGNVSVIDFRELGSVEFNVDAFSRARYDAALDQAVSNGASDLDTLDAATWDIDDENQG